MPRRRAKQEDLRFISLLGKKRISDLKAGEDLAKRTGYTVDELIDKAIADRLRLARKFLRRATDEAESSKPCWRLVTSQTYYSIYHVFRAVVFFEKRGDDHEAHAVLPKHLPNSFPSSSQWENKLKAARLERNKADYDPYPRDTNEFQAFAEPTLADAQVLLPLARKYLRSRGCGL